MNRRAGLSRRTPLRATAALARKTGLRAGKNAPKAAAATRRPVRDTGPSQKIRGLVLARDNWQCVACGKPAGGAFTWWSIQHRLARGQGGTNDPSNLILLCGSATSDGCHLKCEQRDRHMQAQGYWLESWQDPAAEPVMIHGEHGAGAMAWLLPDGQYGFEAPGEAA